MDPVTLMAVGTFTQIMGQYGANIQQAIAERANEAFFKKQADFARLAAVRAQEVASFEYSNKIGEQISAYAGGGVDTGSGSAAITVGATIGNAYNELYALKRKGEIDVQLASMRQGEAGRTANTLSSFGYNFMQAGGTLLKAGASYSQGAA